MNELRSVMVKMGQSPTDEELTAMFNAADKDRDGNIDFQGGRDYLCELVAVAASRRRRRDSDPMSKLKR